MSISWHDVGRSERRPGQVSPPLVPRSLGAMRRPLWRHSCMILCAAAISRVAMASVYFVDRSASGANNGATWFDAFVDLQDAMTVAKFGDEIWIAQGAYLPDKGTFDPELS